MRNTDRGPSAHADRPFWKIVALALLVITIVCLVSTLNYRRDVARSTVQEESLTAEIDTLRHYVEHLGYLLSRQPGLTASEIRELTERGLKDPVSDIENDLRKRKNLIPYEGVLGGTMDFYHIHILSPTWVLADFEDGHIGGSMLLEYSVDRDGGISWKLIKARME